MISLALGLLGGEKADEENRKTTVSFNHRVEIPGGQVLPAGKYVFKVLDPSANPNIIQILSEDEKHLYGTIMAIPTYRLRQTEKTVMTFSTKAAGTPAAIRTWFYPESTRGVEFLYPKMQPRAVDLAKLAGLHPSGVLCELMNDDGTVARMDSIVGFKRRFGLRLISIADLVRHRIDSGCSQSMHRWPSAYLRQP